MKFFILSLALSMVSIVFYLFPSVCRPFFFRSMRPLLVRFFPASIVGSRRFPSLLVGGICCG